MHVLFLGSRHAPDVYVLKCFIFICSVLQVLLKLVQVVYHLDALGESPFVNFC